MTGIAQHAKRAELDSFCQSVREVANAVCGLAEAAAQAAYLVGVSDASSVPGKAGLIDANKFARSVQIVRESCFRVQSGNYSQPQVLGNSWFSSYLDIKLAMVFAFRRCYYNRKTYWHVGKYVQGCFQQNQ